MRVATIPSAFAATFGTALALYSAYLLGRGPFLGGALPSPITLMAALGGFIFGIILLSWGATRLAGVGSRL